MVYRINASLWSFLGSQFREIRSWFRCRFIRKYRHHVVYLETRPGWRDRDERMLFACMSLNCSYVEDACGGEKMLQDWTEDLRSNPSSPERHFCQTQAERQAEALAIYRWWKVQRPADHAHLERWLITLYRNRRFENWTDAETENEVWGYRGEYDTSLGSREECHSFEEALYQRDQEMLHRLVNIRRFL